MVTKFWDIFTSVILFFLGIFLVYDYFFKPDFIDIDYYYHEYSLGSIIGFLIIFSLVMRIISHINSRNERFVDFDSSEGSVGISDKAMKDFVDRVAAKSGLGFILKIKIIEGNSILELSQQMKSRIRQSLTNSLGIENVENIAIKVSEIIKKDSLDENKDENIDVNQ